MVSNLYERVSYSMPVQYINNTFITEYDISKGNISVLKYMGLIDDTLYRELYDAPKQTRVVKIGLMIRNDPDLNKAINQGFIYAKKLLFEANNIQDHEVQAIRKDAVYIIGRKLPYTVFGPIMFTERNTYTGLYNIDKKEFYYYYDPMTHNELLDVKGISDSVLPLHEKYMLDLIKTVLLSLQTDPIDETITLIRSISNKYKNYELESGYYRRFDSESKFQTKSLSKYQTFKLEYLSSESEKKYLDISYNYRIIEGLYRIASSIYFASRK